MSAISSGYKNDLECTLHTVSLTSFNFTARVGFITLLLCECVCVCCAIAFLHVNSSFFLFLIVVACHTYVYYPESFASTCETCEGFLGCSRRAAIPVREPEVGALLRRGKPYSDQTLQSHNHVYALELFNLSATPTPSPCGMPATQSRGRIQSSLQEAPPTLEPAHFQTPPLPFQTD